MELQAKDLRTGNLINCRYIGIDRIIDDELEAVETNITHLSDILKGNSDWEYSPIPLTEEWLVKFGFSKISIPLVKLSGETINYFLEGLFTSTSQWGSFRWHEGYAIEIKYVHQLQNLYFALTGEELTT
jgi:hypothetical protein